MKSESSSAVSITVPKDPSMPKIHIGSTILWLYGKPKIGKTSLAAQFPDAVFILTEPGTKFLRTRTIEFDGRPICDDWDQFRSFVRYAETRGLKASTIVIDTVDQLFQLCFDSVCDRLKVSHPADMGHGKGWSAIRLEWAEWVTRLCNLGTGVIFISHVRERDVKTLLDTSTKLSPALPTTGYEAINGLSDYIFLYDYTVVKKRSKKTGKKVRREVRCLYCRSTADIEAGDRSDLMPNYIEMPPGPAAYAALEAAFQTALSKMKRILKEGKGEEGEEGDEADE
jgi:hypothetical protein